MMRPTAKTTLVLVVAGFFAAAPVSAWDPIGVVKASDNLAAAAAKLPEGLKDTLGVSIVALSNEMRNRIADIQNIIPVMGREMSGQLDHAALIGEELARQVDQIAAARISQLSAEVQKQLLLMQKIIADALAQVDQMVKGWIKETEGAAVRVIGTAQTGALQVVDKIELYLIRFVSLALLLLGLLLTGLRLLTFWGSSWDWKKLADNKHLTAILSAVFSGFFAVTLILAIFPESLASLSARLKAAPYDNACRQLTTEQALLAAAQTLSNPAIKEQLTARVAKAGQICLAGGKKPG